LQRGKDTVPTAYPPKEIKTWAGRLRAWAAGEAVGDLPLVTPARDAAEKRKPREVFAYVIHNGKVRAPAGAMALISSLKSKR
jgi:uncharacterized protein YecE (DUF72 family)